MVFVARQLLWGWLAHVDSGVNEKKNAFSKTQGKRKQNWTNEPTKVAVVSVCFGFVFTVGILLNYETLIAGHNQHSEVNIRVNKTSLHVE